MQTPSLVATALASQGLASFEGLARMFDIFWDATLFKGEVWEPLMNGLRIMLTFGGALLLMYEVRARRMGERIRERTKKRLGLAFTVLAFGAYFDFFNPNVRFTEYYHRHEFYHYYLGSKYFKEVGYYRLYECTAVAETELGRGAAVQAREIRDLRQNLIKQMRDPSVQKHLAECKGNFSGERWAAFKQEVDWFYHSSVGSYWDGMTKDHGYNPPPLWTMEGHFFGSLGVADDGFFKLMSVIDPLLQLGCVLMIGWAFGWRIMAIATVFWGCNAPANFYWTGGAFIRQDWIFFLVASLCLARKRMFFLAGGALTWSTLLRVFPGMMILGWVIIIAIETIRRLRRLPGTDAKGVSFRNPLSWFHPDHKRLILGCVVAVGVLIPASMAVAGRDSYKTFVEHISVHKNTPLTNHMGLETILAHDFEGRMHFTRDESLDDPFQVWKEGRTQRFKNLQPVYFTIVGLLFAWTVWALRRTKLLWVGLALSLPLTMSLTNLTCYYYSMYIVAASLVLLQPALAPAYLALSGASQVLLLGTPVGFYYVDDRYAAESYLFFIFSLLMLVAYSRPFSIERLKAWWQGKPDPKPKTAPPPSTSREAPAE
jgi:hypothetical protein